MWRTNLLLLTGPLCWAQNLDVSELDESQWSEQEVIQFTEELESYEREPMSLYKIGPLALAEHPIISLKEAVNICLYMEASGPIMDWGELTNVRGINEHWIESRKPYLTLSRSPSGWRWNFSSIFKSKLILGVKFDDFRKQGYISGEYEGHPFQDQGRLEVSNRTLDVQMHWQRDAGEVWNPLDRGLVDHLSFGLTLKPHSHFTLGLGNYRLGRFLGTHVGTRFGSSIPQSISDIQARSSQTRTSASAAEFNQWTGVCLSKNRGQWTGQIQMGQALWDGRVENHKVISISSTGLHRSTSERATTHTIMGYHVGWQAGYASPSTQLSLAQDLFQLRPRTSPSQQNEGGSSIYVQHIQAKDLFEAELAMDFEWESALQMIWTRDMGDLKIGARYYGSSLRYREGLLRPNGWFYSNGRERSIAALFSFSRYDHQWNFTVFHADLQELEWNQKMKSGWQCAYASGRFAPAFQAKYRWTNSGQIVNHFIQSVWRHPLQHGELLLRNSFHFQTVSQGTVGMAMDYKSEGAHWKWIARFRYQQVGKEKLPIYFMQPSTRLQMRIQSLYHSGFGTDFLFTWRGSPVFQWQIQSYFDFQFNTMERGSGHDKIESPFTGGLTLELQWKW